MEELRSTDILDREILEDARKKAARILKSAGDTLESQTRTWGEKADLFLAEAKSRYEKRLAVDSNEIMARLPLDCRRIRVQRMEEMLLQAVHDYLSGLSRSRVFSVLKTELKRRIDFCPELKESGEINVYYQGMSETEADALLTGTLQPKKGKKPWVLHGTAENPSEKKSGNSPSLVIDTLPVRIKVSVDAVVETILQDKRAELITALLGEEALNA
ncbi:hypothetical protein FACS1894151_00500 [Spirochaetia bacterium]|nr:hypothetical protein FACS1894151_00500 [Spirochaetia bacterium]